MKNRRLPLRLLPVLFATCLLPSPGFAQQQPDVSKLTYLLDLTDAKNQYAWIEMTVPVTEEQTQLMMAVWTPGSYLVREYARNIDSIEVTDDDGEPVPFTKTRKNRWTVESTDVKNLHVRYRLYCNELSVRTNWIGNEYAVLNGGATFLTVPDRLDQPHEVSLKLPRNWQRSATSLKTVGEHPHQYLAQNFDELVDSPIVAGNIMIYPFEVGGVQHQLVNVGESGYWDGAKAATNLGKVVAAHHEMWGIVPYQRYLFLNVICGRGGGLEHDNCSTLMTSIWSFRDEERYKDWLSLASHEFFHAWNVRRLRPRGLVKYDYESENYTPSLWIAEGITSYYEDLLLVRAGLISKKEFLERLNKNIEGVQKTPGRAKQSLSESSYDAWIKFYRPDENSRNTRISYYSKGAVVAFLLDTKIRELTDGAKSLDDVMRTMYQRYQKSGYEPSDFRRVASEIAGDDLNDWFASAVDSTDELDFSNVDNWFGLEFPPTSEQAKLPKEADESASDGSEEASTGAEPPESRQTNDANAKKSVAQPTRWLGFSGIERISRVEPDSPASNAGLNTDDELIAIDGFRVTDRIDGRLKQYQVGDQLDLLIARGGKLMHFDLTVGSKDDKSWKLKESKNQTADQKQRVNRWLGIKTSEPGDKG